MFVIVGKVCIFYMNEKRMCISIEKQNDSQGMKKLPYASIFLPNTSGKPCIQHFWLIRQVIFPAPLFRMQTFTESDGFCNIFLFEIKILQSHNSLATTANLQSKKHLNQISMDQPWIEKHRPQCVGMENG